MFVATLTALVTVIAPTAAPRIAAASTDAAAVRLQSLNDPTIVAIYDAANTYDIEAAHLAERKATTKEIRDFAAMLVMAHTDARQKGRDLAKKLGVTPTPPKQNPLAPDHTAAMKRLNSLSGKAFDRAFLENEVAYHKAVISAVTTTLLPAIQNAQLKQLVVSVSPVFVQHQKAAESLLAKMPA
jgi:putative membrane protein